MRFSPAIIVSLFLCQPLYAQEKEQGWPEGSAMSVGLQANEKTKKITAEIDKKQAILVDMLTKNNPDNPRLVSSVKAQYEAWKKYYPTECEMVGAATGAGGSWPSAWASVCENKLVEEKLANISSVADCMKNYLDMDNPEFNQTQCIYKLNIMATDATK